MKTGGWLGNWLTRMTRLACTGCLIALPACACAQIASPESLVGRSFWYEPSHDKYVPTDFYVAPAIDAAKDPIARKSRITVVDAKKNWFAIRFERSPGLVAQVFIPIADFRARLYQAERLGDARANFMRASLFEVDPDIVKRQFESKEVESAPTLTPKPSAKLKPWQKYKENWGSVTPAPKKNKRLLLDDIKQTEEPATPP